MSVPTGPGATTLHVMLRDPAAATERRTDQARLGCRVVRLTCGAEEADHGRHQDDAPAACAQHALRRSLGDAEGGREVGVDDRREVGLAHAQQQAVVGDAGVGHEHFHRAELGLDGGEGGIDRGRRCDIALDGEEAGRGRRRVVGDGDSVAERGEALRARETDAA
jgi:hypothetical protein